MNAHRSFPFAALRASAHCAQDDTTPRCHPERSEGSLADFWGITRSSVRNPTQILLEVDTFGIVLAALLRFKNVLGRSLPARAKEDLPVLDLCNAQQPQRCPRIVRESGSDFLLAFGFDDQQDFLPIAEWAAEDDEAVVYECVHERCMLIPLLLLAHGKS